MKLAGCVMVGLLAIGASALTVQVEPRSEECYIFECTKGDYVNVNVQVIRGGLLDINVKVKKNNNNNNNGQNINSQMTSEQ